MTKFDPAVIEQLMNRVNELIFENEDFMDEVEDTTDEVSGITFLEAYEFDDAGDSGPIDKRHEVRNDLIDAVLKALIADRI